MSSDKHPYIHSNTEPSTPLRYRRPQNPIGGLAAPQSTSRVDEIHLPPTELTTVYNSIKRRRISLGNSRPNGELGIRSQPRIRISTPLRDIHRLRTKLQSPLSAKRRRSSIILQTDGSVTFNPSYTGPVTLDYLRFFCKVTLEEQSKEETSSKSQNKETGVHPNLTTDLKIPTTVTTQESSSDNEHTTNQSFILAGNTDVLFGSPESVVASDNFIQDNPFIEPLKEANQPTRSFSYLERILASQATRNSSAVTQIVNDKLLANASLPDKFKSSNHGDTKVSFISPEKGLESTQRSPSVSTAINDEIPMEELAVLSNNEEESQSGSPSVFVPQEDDISDHSEMIQINSPTFSPTQPESFEDDIPVEGDNHSAGFPGDSSDDHDMFGYTPLDQVHKFDNDILPRIDDTSIIDKPYLVSRVSGKTNSENSNGLDSDYGLSRKTIKSLLGSLTLENNKKRKRLKSTSEALGLVQQQSETFLTNLTSDLEVYARHRGGTEITIRDVMLFIRRLKYPTVNGARANNVNYFSELAGKHLPLESLMELNNCLKNTYYTNMVEVDDQDLDDSDINEDPSIENFTDDSS